jgi:hypothetical protein
MHRIIQKVHISVAGSLLLLGFIAPVVGLQASASADTLTENVACNDGSTDLKTTTSKKNHTTTVACKSGASIIANTSEDTGTNQSIGLSVTCPNSEQAGSTLKNPNGENPSMTFYCETTQGNGDNLVHKKTSSTPKASQVAANGTVVCADGVTPAPNNDVSQCPADAQDQGNCAKISNCDLITTYINPFVRLLSAIVGVAVVISIVIGGIQYSSSGGDSSKVTAAKNRIRNSIVALVTYIFLFALLNFLIPGGIV